ncbi:Receptor-type tyrosine-protein phosphatase F [Stylophora pistillata]|uniref:Receptor-type tyrosine-protein phosphatase F n=1 Tax=Stylophora pistillata TaxID=50429 RepID=A0A2B4RDM6_STYPI|nr:Receptor-type tyrosine-protein phosphatase F [Stylophora pistillata]
MDQWGQSTLQAKRQESEEEDEEYGEASADCIDLDLGMKNGAISDDEVTASSVQSASTPGKNGRLNYASGSSWCAGTSDTNPYLQIDLQTLHIICAVSTQGNSQADQWVKNYKLQLSTDGTTWTDYQEGGKVKTFQGNDDKISEVKHVLYVTVEAKFLRLLPKAYHGSVCLRTELFGVKQKPVNIALGKATIQSSTFNNTQLGVSGVSGNAVDGNSNTVFRYGSCAHTRGNNPSWWRVDLGSDKVAVSDIFIVNRFSTHTTVLARSENYKIALDNLAFRKQTEQSSVQYGGVSSRAVDGISNPSYHAGSCTHTGRDYNPWWRVDLGQVEPVAEIYLVNRIDEWFFRQNSFEIRVACQMQAIGVASNDTLPDASFSASSERTSYEAFRGRLHAFRGWSPNRNDRPDDYLQVDLQYEFLICAVATQGRSTYDNWTTKYKLQLSFDGSFFATYKENNVDKIFNGNSGRSDIVKHKLRAVRARFIRFQPVKFQRRKVLRVEVYGVLISKAPSQAPSNLTLIASSSTSITASWQLPSAYSRHGIIAGFRLFYKKKGFMGSMSAETINNGTTLSGDIIGLDKYTEYEFKVLAFTSHGDGPKSSVEVERTMEDEPSGGPANVSSAEVNKTTFNITWVPLPGEQSNGDIILYSVKEELLSRGTRQNRSSLSSKTVNTTNTFILLSGLLLCSQYQVSVRAYTKVGPGPYGPPVELPRTADPGTPWGLSASNVGTTQVRLEWKEPKLTPKEGIGYRVKYLGTKPYNESFREEGFQDLGSSTSYTMKGLVPGSIYEFQIIVSSVCGLGVPKGFPDRVETEMTEHFRKNSKKFKAILVLADNGTQDLSLIPNLTFADVETYAKLKSGCQNTVKAYKFFAEPYLHEIKVSYTTDYVARTAKCFRSMKKTESPHNISANIELKDKSLSGKCSCVAGIDGYCLHIIALFFYLAHCKQLGLRSLPDDLTCTSMKQRWSVPRGKKIEQKQIQDILVKKHQMGANYSKFIKSTLYLTIGSCFSVLYRVMEHAGSLESTKEA